MPGSTGRPRSFLAWQVSREDLTEPDRKAAGLPASPRRQQHSQPSPPVTRRSSWASHDTDREYGRSGPISRRRQHRERMASGTAVLTPRPAHHPATESDHDAMSSMGRGPRSLTLRTSWRWDGRDGCRRRSAGYGAAQSLRLSADPAHLSAAADRCGRTLRVLRSRSLILGPACLEPRTRHANEGAAG